MRWNRREMVRGLGAAGLGALGAGPAAVARGGETPSAVEVLSKLRLLGASEAEFLDRLGRGAVAASRLPAGTKPRLERIVEAEVVASRGLDGTPFAYGLGFRCDPRFLSRLAVGGAPLVARRICFSAAEIGWTPGLGAPVYASYAPRYEYGVGAYYPGARWHQIVPVLGDRTYFNGCQGDDVCEGPEAAAVAFDVNDSHYDDNAGSYRIIIWSWS